MTREIFDVDAPYKFTFPIEKAETRDDGMYLIGIASGPEIDSQNERVHPSLIQKWADQINGGDQPEVIYRDWHNKNSSLADLGVVTKAWVDDDSHLVIETRLDEDNPTAIYIHKSILKKGKKYGMSVFGKVHRFADEFDAKVGRTVRTFYDATLEEVSNTTRPVYTPSFGTVLSKAVDDSAADEVNMATEEKTTETKVEVTEEVVSAPATETGTEGEKVVEKSASESTDNAQSIDQIVSTFKTLGSQLESAGLLKKDDTSVNDKAENTVTKSEEAKTTTEETTSAPEIVMLQKSVNDLASIVAALADNIKDGSAPGLIRKSEAVDPLQELKDVEDPLERLRLSFAASHGEALR